MAHRKDVPAEYDGSPLHIYTVTYPVGLNKCSNVKVDVMLVQFLVKSYFKDPENAASKPGANLTVNGLFDTSTQVYLKSFASHIQRKGIAITVDGRYDPCGNAPRGSISRQYYKIYVLSRCYWDFLERQGQEQRYYHLDKETSSDVPALLKAAIGPYKGPLS